ncbi:MBL fold metallo-hydrolase [Lentisphaerota bacterium WC36G]|nr:MBL fold metallo-hydrolase [Lentisphaerae bacterium WC36]
MSRNNVHFISLGSGSKGNSFLVGFQEEYLMIDAGFSRKELVKRLAEAEIEPKSIKAVLITHDHEDHVKGCRVFCDSYKIPAYVSFKSANYLGEPERNKLPKKVREFESGNAFMINDFMVLPFSVQHDSIDAVGFTFEIANKKVGIATDIGSLNLLAKQRLHDCDILVIESNYDLDMLREANRPMQLKRRIMGKFGHLGNIECLEALEHLITERTKNLCLVHLSEDCNDFEIVKDLATMKLGILKRSDITLEIAKQNSIGKLLYC